MPIGKHTKRRILDLTEERLSAEDIAAATGLTTETAARFLSEMAGDGLLRRVSVYQRADVEPPAPPMRARSGGRATYVPAPCTSASAQPTWLDALRPSRAG